MSAPSVSKAVAGVQSALFHFATAITGAVAGIARFRVPQNTQILRVGAAIDTSTATVADIEVKAGGNTILAAPLALIPAAPTAPVAAMANPAAPGDVTDGTHSYVVTFVNAIGESQPSAKSNVLDVVNKAVNGQVVVTIPVGPAGTTDRKVYRTVAGDAGDHLLVDTVAGNVATTYTDNVADGALGAAAPTDDQSTVGTFQEASLDATKVTLAKEAEVTVDVDALTGTSIAGLSVQIDYVRVG